MMGLFKLAVHNLRRNRRRNAAACAAITLGFAALVLCNGYANRIQNYLRVYTQYSLRMGHLQITPRGGLTGFGHAPNRYSFNPGAQEVVASALNASANVAFFGRELSGVGLVGNGDKSTPFVAAGIEPQVDERLRSSAEMARWAPNLRGFLHGQGLWRVAPERNPVAITPGLARILRKTPGDADPSVQLMAAPWSGGMAAQNAEVVAHYSTGFTESDNAAMTMPLQLLQNLYETDNISVVKVWLHDATQAQTTAQRLREALASRHVVADVHVWDDERLSPLYAGSRQLLQALVGFLGVVLASMITFSVFNAATLTVMERAPEIGALRALGFTVAQVRRVYLLEGGCLASVGLALGGCLGSAAVAAINRANISFNAPGAAGSLRLLLVPEPRFVAAAMAALLALTVLAVAVALRSQTRQKIVVLLERTQR